MKWKPRTLEKDKKIVFVVRSELATLLTVSKEIYFAGGIQIQRRSETTMQFIENTFSGLYRNE